MRRFALVMVAGLALFAGTAPGARADAGSQPIVTATVYSASGTQPDSVTLDDLQQNLACQQYPGQSMEELGRQGFVDVPLPPAGTQTGTWSLSTILGCLETPVPLAAVNDVIVVNGDGSPEVGSGSQLSRADLASPSDFSNSSDSPVIEDHGSVIQYDRPWRGSQSDYDFLDEVQASDNGQPAPIEIEVFEGPHLSVNINASGTSVPVGSTVTFSATVSPPGQSGLTYNWNFDGGSANSSAAAPQATFDTAGLYNVTVQVTDAAGGGGGASVPITVGTPPPAASGSHNQSGGGKSKKSHTPTGPVHSGGTSPGAPAGNSSASQSTAGHGSGTGSTASAGRATSGSHTPSAHTTANRAAGRGSAPLSRLPATNVGPRAPLVAGQLVADVLALPAADSPLVHTVKGSAASAPPARQAIRASVLPVLAGALAVALVFLLGAGRELRWRLRSRLAHLGN